ncbi:two-component sensor histidine kinase [Streptomyces kaniharaensis]|uniref:histidine kinase n=1 Tax=Streptomyces kaniharaensis TaxID=212423 RepID=A0A6N7KT31_9ACTN|nr:histidine kinase [Streptomyces kaniharaensis]MQS13164.1 two-component sensor histidine kinase [Streptomyces kaniharaensis]
MTAADQLPSRRLPAWCTAPWLMLLLPVLYSLLDAALVARDARWWQVTLSVLAALALLWRRRLPVTVLLLTMPGSFVDNIWLAPITAVYTVAAERPSPRIVIACGTLFTLVEFFHWPLSAQNFEPSRDLALYAIQSVMLAAGPAATGLLARTRRELAARVDELTRGQERESRLLAERVLISERGRLAREMHDVVSHQVSLISIQAGALQVSTADPAAAATARTIRELSVRTLDELRQMVGVLRTSGPHQNTPLAPQPRLADLPRLIEESGLAAEAELTPGDRPWPEAVERAAYRTVQEALTNITKYAPDATVHVKVRAKGRRLRVEVRNERPPVRPAETLPGGGHGLVGLRERAQLLGGTLAAGPTHDGGFEVRAELPASRG